MNREDENQQQHSRHTTAASAADNETNHGQTKGFAYQRSPSQGGIRQPTRFGRSDSQDNIAMAAGKTQEKVATNGSQKPPIGSIISSSGGSTTHHHGVPLAHENFALSTFPQVEEVTPRQLHTGRDTREPDESLLISTPSASERKILNSLLSDDEASHFEPTQVSTLSARKRTNRFSMAAISTTAQKDNVKVVIRVRPINDREKAGGTEEKVKLCLAVEENKKITLDRGMDQKTFTFDYVATPEAPQQILFETIAKPIADSCLQGYNGSIFAYGQTGSGKTFTIQGPTMIINGEETLIGASNTNDALHEKRGLMQRSFEYLFACMESQKQEAEKCGIQVQFLVKSSYLEIYNEQIMDLLDPQSYNLHIREDIKKGVYVESLNEETVTGVKEMMNLTTRGARNRHVGSTLMNKESSRSHSVLTTTIESKTMNDEGVWQMKSSRFHIIDLAGSERSKNTQAVGERLKEAGMINKSLTALGIVINSLVEISEGKNRHVHYRDSKLTFLLRDSLGGNSKTVIIANVTAAAISVGETLSTLKFAQRAKLIKNKAVINEESSSTIHLLKAELRSTKKDLAEKTNQLKIAYDQIDYLQQNVPEVKSEIVSESSIICKVCKNNVIGEEQDLNLHFQDTSGLYHSHSGMKDIEESSLLDMPSERTPNGTQILQTMQQSNPKAFKLYKQRAAELTQMKERVSKVEKLLSENLENMDIQQKQYESQIDTLTKQNKDKQTALEASEKNRARDKMIIKFREERIAELEARLAKSQTGSPNESINCDECPSLKKQLADAQTEIAQWIEVSDKNPQAAKLFAENQELIVAKKALQSELKVSPESLTARIRGLNELTNNLNSYLKEYCMSEGFDRLKQQLETLNQEMTSKVESLEAQLAEKDTVHIDKINSLTGEYESVICTLTEKIEQSKASFESDKVRIEQEALDQMTRLKADLDATLAEKGELQKEIFDKVEAHEKQVIQKKSIDILNQTLDELRTEKETLLGALKKEQDEVVRLTELNRQTETNMLETTRQLQDQIESEKDQLNQTIKEIIQKANQEIQDLEKEVATAKEEIRMQEEQSADLDVKIRTIQEENDSLQKQVIETNEEIQEKRRHVKEIEAKLNSTIRDLASKSDQMRELEESLNSQLAVQMAALAQIKIQDAAKTQQLSLLEGKFNDSSVRVQSLEKTLTTVTSDKEMQETRLQELEHIEKQLQKKVALTEGKVEECARYEVEQQLLQKKLQVYEMEVQSLTEQLNQALKAKNETQEQYEGVKVQVIAMEELSVSLTKQSQLHEGEIANLRASITEKDLEMAKTIREVDLGNSQLRQSLIEEKATVTVLQSEINDLKKELSESKHAANTTIVEMQVKIENLEKKLKIEKENVLKESKKAELAKSKVEQTIQLQEREVQKVIHELQQETQNKKFKLELEYQTLIQNKENELRQTFATNQTKDHELFQSQINEVQRLRFELSKQKQARQIALTSVQRQVKLLKQQHQGLVDLVRQELTWKRVGPKLNIITGLVDKVKVVALEHANMKQYKQEAQELLEQLVEYKGLTLQLQEEKKSLNTRLQENLNYVEIAKTQNSEIIQSLNVQLQTTQTELAEAHQMMRQQKHMAEESLKLLNQQHVDQFQRLADQSRMTATRLSEEADQLRKQREDAQKELQQYKSKTSEQQSLLITSKETITNMVSNENQLMTELKRKITELGEKQEQYKARVMQTKQEKEAVTSKYETLKKENENLRELIKIKDGQIEDSRGYEQDRRGERERLYAENKKQKEMLQQRENEIKEVVMTLKAFADEKKRLEKENERMRSQEMQVGHNNQAQKIQHHLRIKEENNKLKEENYALLEQVRRIMSTGGGAAASTNVGLNSNATFGNLATDAINQQPGQSGAPSSVEQEKLRKELTSVHDSVARLAESLLRLPGVGQFVSSNEQLATHFKKHPIPQGAGSTSSSTYYANQKIKGTQEVIGHICKQLQARVQECNQMTVEFKKMEAEIHQLQTEKSHLLQGITSAQGQQQQVQVQPRGQQQNQSITMQPSFQMAPQAQQQRPGSISSQQQQHQLLAQGQPNQYRRQNSRGHQAASQQLQSQPTSVSPSASVQGGQAHQQQSQTTLQQKQMHLLLQQQSMNRM